MADHYYSLIAHAVSRVPRNNDEVRHAIYEQSRTALQERLSTYRPPLSEAALANEHFALEAAISRVEEDLLLSVMRQFVKESRVSSWSKLKLYLKGKGVRTLGRGQVHMRRAKITQRTAGTAL